jgi:hypothetical protein
VRYQYAAIESRHHFTSGVAEARRVKHIPRGYAVDQSRTNVSLGVEERDELVSYSRFIVESDQSYLNDAFTRA